MTSILLVDDHPMVRGGLKTALGVVAGWTVIGEADNGQQGLALVQRCRPDILIVDLQMPGMSGMEVLRSVVASVPSTRVIVFSMHAEDAYVREALDLGAHGYVLKDADASELINAIRTVSQGGRYLSPLLAERMINAYLGHVPDAGGIGWMDVLTKRERQILVLAGQGLNAVEIGERLTISPRTAETHRTNLMRKLGLKGLRELERFAREQGLLEAS
ncbi:response regulator [Candidatus Viridilinea mediisalina]|nr:response regulator transcription factor [Candidatus Viridilinea mediisalina]